MSVFGFLAVILGPLMRLVYQLIPNFALTMIVFTIILRVAMLPLAISSRNPPQKCRCSSLRFSVFRKNTRIIRKSSRKK